MKLTPTLILTHVLAVLLGVGVVTLGGGSDERVSVTPDRLEATGETEATELFIKATFGPVWGTRRRAANESAARATLRSIRAAQNVFLTTAAVDTDGNGAGEYGYLAELAGAAPLRRLDPVEGPPVLLDPPCLAPSFGKLLVDGAGDGVVERSGYYFKVFLAGPNDGDFVPGVGEAPTGGAPRARMTSACWGSSNCEVMWCAYAWPCSKEVGELAFFINQEGELLQLAGSGYCGLDQNPPAGAAFDPTWHMGIGGPVDSAALDPAGWVPSGH